MQLKASFCLDGIKSRLSDHFKGKILQESGFSYSDKWERHLNEDSKEKLEKNRMKYRG